MASPEGESGREIFVNFCREQKKKGDYSQKQSGQLKVRHHEEIECNVKLVQLVRFFQQHTR